MHFHWALLFILFDGGDRCLCWWRFGLFCRNAINEARECGIEWIFFLLSVSLSFLSLFLSSLLAHRIHVRFACVCMCFGFCFGHCGLRSIFNVTKLLCFWLGSWFALCCQIGYNFSFYYWLVCVAAAATMNSSMSLKTKHKSNLERAFHCRIFAFNMMIIMKNTIKILSQSRRKSLMTQFFVLYEEKEIVDRFLSANKFLLFHCTENLGHRILYRLLTLFDSLWVFDFRIQYTMFCIL